MHSASSVSVRMKLSCPSDPSLPNGSRKLLESSSNPRKKSARSPAAGTIIMPQRGYSTKGVLTRNESTSRWTRWTYLSVKDANVAPFERPRTGWGGQSRRGPTQGCQRHEATAALRSAHESRLTVGGPSGQPSRPGTTQGGSLAHARRTLSARYGHGVIDMLGARHGHARHQLLRDGGHAWTAKISGIGDLGCGWLEHLRQWLGTHWPGLSPCGGAGAELGPCQGAF